MEVTITQEIDHGDGRPLVYEADSDGTLYRCFYDAGGGLYNRTWMDGRGSFPSGRLALALDAALEAYIQERDDERTRAALWDSP